VALGEKNRRKISCDHFLG